jgi:hypothetical protein
MRLILLSVASLLMTHGASASAGTASGSGGLALSALVAINSPALSATDKKVMAALFSGKLTVPFPAGKKISIAADSVTCLAGDVDITRHSCNLVFGKKKITLGGSKAHQLYATLVEVGVPSDGAAGTIYESLEHLNCTVDPNEVKQRDGGGVACHFDTGAP